MSSTTAKTALARLTAEPTRYDLVILDVMLPGIDGFDVVAELRRARPIRAGADADRARPLGRRAARVRRRAPTTTCRSRSSCRSCCRASRACCAGTSGSGSRPPAQPTAVASQFRVPRQDASTSSSSKCAWARRGCR